MSKRLSLTAVLAAALTFCAAQGALAEKRVALVLGMSKYQNVPALTNPARDAAAMGEVFKKAGFDVVDMKLDLTVSGLRREVRDFAGMAADADIAVVYYAGHGIEVDGTNYLIPADARLVSDFDIPDETVSLDRVLQALEPVKRLRLVILDACRDNPFNKTMKRSIGGTRSIGRGLAQVEPTTANTLIAFAAKAGAVAGDGDGNNSPFATALMKYLTAPGLDLRLAFGKVRDDVVKSTGNRQEPFMYGSLGGDTVALVPQSVIPPADPNAEARKDYEFAAQLGTKEAWASFLAARPTGLYADLARQQAAKLNSAESASAKADDSIKKAEEQARQKADDFRKQLQEQAKKQAEDDKRAYDEKSKKDLEIARQQIADRAQAELDEARRQVEAAKKQAADAQKQIDDAKRQAVEDAAKQVAAAKAEADKAKVASLSPTAGPQPPAPPPVPAMDATDIARLLQAHLKRVGCDPGNTDGNWNASSSKALDNFNKNASTTFDVKVASLNSLDGVRAKTGRVCPLVCGKGQKVEDDRCVAITCDSGFILNSDGVCKKRPDPPERKAVARSEAPARVAPSGGGGGGGGKCFSFNGKRYCE
ncbi:MAG: caspase family protein [Afipia sp.]|nr:caspase family protein [Afipia sp.]